MAATAKVELYGIAVGRPGARGRGSPSFSAALARKPGTRNRFAPGFAAWRISVSIFAAFLFLHGFRRDNVPRCAPFTGLEKQ